MKNLMTNQPTSTQRPMSHTEIDAALSKDDALEVETHPFAPVLPANASVMMMGTFPPTADKWAMRFHYPNFYNDMWRIYGGVFFDDIDYFRVEGEKRFDPERIRDFLFDRGIASCPTVKQAIRETGNASDKHLTVVTPVDLDNILLQVPKVKTLFTTGGKATEVLLSLLAEPPAKSKHPKTNQSMQYPYQWQRHDKDHAVKELTLYRLPSTSRAYPLALDKKIAAYKAFFEKIGKL